MASHHRRALSAVLALALGLLTAAPAAAQLIVVGNDEKVGWDDAGRPVLGPPGRDSISIVDIASREAPAIVASLPLMNSIFGPPVNLAVTPDERLAIVASSMQWQPDGPGWKAVPDNKLYVIDLAARPPRHIATVEVGKQPSGLSISPRGDLALVANRADSSISVLTIHHDEVKLVDTVAIGEQVAAVVFAPDGRRAFAVKFPGHKIAVLEIAGETVTYAKQDLPVGLWPYNLGVTPNGKLLLTADNGNAGGPDGHVDTVTVVDIEAAPPRVIDKVVIGDAPEGFAMSPTGEIAVAVLLGSRTAPKGAWFGGKNGSVAVLGIDGKKVTKVGEVEVGGLPEGVVFSPDGKYLYVGNFLDRDVSILRVDGTTVTDTGKKLVLPGHPASMRGRVQ